jgi:hypothetical protein
MACYHLNIHLPSYSCDSTYILKHTYHRIYNYVSMSLSNCRTLKSTVFWVLMLCRLEKTNISVEHIISTFRVKRLSLQSCFCWFLARLTLWPWRQRWYVPPKCQAFMNALRSRGLYFSVTTGRTLMMTVVFKPPSHYNVAQICPHTIYIKINV